MIVIADYGIGNVSSVRNMLEKVGCRDVAVSGDPGIIAGAQKLILPGVGAFDYGANCLRQGGRIDALNEAVIARRVPILGICLGMQLMCRGSEEGDVPGLGWIDGYARRFVVAAEQGLKVPHMGWNVLHVAKDSPLLPAAEDSEQRFYFVHSFHVVCAEAADVVATASHGENFVAAFRHGNIFGVQFHPEKSHRFGMALMRRFAELPC